MQGIHKKILESSHTREETVWQRTEEVADLNTDKEDNLTQMKQIREKQVINKTEK